MKRAILSSLLIIFCLVIVLGGCDFNKKTSRVVQESGYEVQDYQGNSVKLSGKPERIVALTLATDEILLSLVSPSKIAALTYLADDPGISNITDNAKQVPGRVKAELESIISLKPDLVIVANWQPIELIKSIKEAGITVYVYKTPTSIAEIKQVITELAIVLGEEAKGAELVANMDIELATVTDKVKNIPADKKQTVIRYTLMGATYGTGSLFDDICKYAGVENGVSKVGGKNFDYLSKEKIVAVNPDMFILPSWDFAGKKDVNQFKNDVQNDPAFKSINAVKNDKVVMVADKKISTGSQYITVGVKEIAMLAYNDCVSK